MNFEGEFLDSLLEDGTVIEEADPWDV